MDEILKFIKDLVAVAGGFSVALFAFSKFGLQKAAEIFVEKYKAEFEKDVERYKTELENKKYITQKHYDRLFEVYENLNDALCDAIEAMEQLIPGNYPDNTDDRKNFLEEKYQEFKATFEIAKNSVSRYAAFVEESMDFDKLLTLLQKQLDVTENMSKTSRTDLVGDADRDRAKEIRKQMTEISKAIKAYLLSLEVVK